MDRSTIRVGTGILAIVLLAPVASAFLTDQLQHSQTKRVEDVTGPNRSGYTAITTQEFKETYPESELVVLAQNGSTVHVNDEHDSYFDVDPVPDRPDLVEYVAADLLTGDDCDEAKRCTRELLIRENFRTGESEVLWSRVSPGEHSTRIHDVDRLNETHVAVADIYTDRVFVYDLERGIRVWTWDAQRDYPIDSGGPFPDDWTHMNDVEALSDGTLMVSLRNHDSVVFLAPNGTLLSDRTLGADDRTDVVHEQHNPDYLGGSPPAVIVSDSENDRVVEYERRDGEWELSWGWRDSRLRWPRDADRLPNGHTLVTDSNGDRVIEVDGSGDVVWSVDVGLPYEAERLSTGDESAGGPAASAAGLESNLNASHHSSGEGRSVGDAVASLLERVVPDPVVQGLAFVLPPWLGIWHVLLLGLAVVDLAVWAVLEYRFSDWSLDVSLRRGGGSGTVDGGGAVDGGGSVNGGEAVNSGETVNSDGRATDGGEPVNSSGAVDGGGTVNSSGAVNSGDGTRGSESR